MDPMGILREVLGKNWEQAPDVFTSLQNRNNNISWPNGDLSC